MLELKLIHVSERAPEDKFSPQGSSDIIFPCFNVAFVAVHYEPQLPIRKLVSIFSVCSLWNKNSKKQVVIYNSVFWSHLRDEGQIL